MWFTIIVLAYNQEKYILDCLNSIKAQIQKYNEGRYKMQLIIGDDASNDATEQKVKMWIEKNEKNFDECIYIRNAENKGTCANYLDALKSSKGDYIKAVGGDDLFPENSIYEIIQQLDQYDIVYGNALEYSEDSRIEDITKHYFNSHCINKEEAKIAFYKRIHRYCCLVGPATYVSTRLLKHPEVIKFLEEYKYIDDYTQWLKMSEIKAVNTLYIENVSIIYRRTEGSAYIKKRDAIKNEIDKVYKYAYEHAGDFRTKVIVRNFWTMIRHNNLKISKYFCIINWINRWHIIKNKNEDCECIKTIVSRNIQYLNELVQVNRKRRG